LKQKYIEDKIFDVNKGIIDKQKESFSMVKSWAIVKLINNKPNAIFFSVDCVKLHKNLYSFTDIREIDSDEYLDLINLKLNLNEI